MRKSFRFLGYKYPFGESTLCGLVAWSPKGGHYHASKTRVARPGQGKTLAAKVAAMAAERADGAGFLLAEQPVGGELLFVETRGRAARSRGGGPDQMGRTA